MVMTTLMVYAGLLCVEPQAGYEVRKQVSDAADALALGDPKRALLLAQQAVTGDPNDPWAHYNRAAALAELGKVDEAVAAYQAAEQRFGTADNWGRSVAMWGRAHLQYRNGRCDQAKAAFKEYFELMKAEDPESAALAERRSQSCRPR